MVTVQEFTYPSSDGVHQVWCTRWQPEGEVRAVVQLVHGISEYIGRYDAFARFLAGHGYLVVGNDHLGHGRTATGPQEYGFLAQTEGWTHLANDVHTLRTMMGMQYTQVPYYLMGHSMGSFVARTYLIRWPGTLDGCILSGTGQENAVLVAFGHALTGLLCRLRGPNTVSRLVTALTLGAYNKQFKPNRTSADWICRDKEVVDAYVADPLCRFVPTVGMNHDLMGGLKLISNASELAKMNPDTPVYLFSGDQDPVGGNGRGVEKVKGFFQRAGTKDVKLKLYPGGRHEMLNETNRQEVFEDALAWLEGHVRRAQEKRGQEAALAGN